MAVELGLGEGLAAGVGEGRQGARRVEELAMGATGWPPAPGIQAAADREGQHEQREHQQQRAVAAHAGRLQASASQISTAEAAKPYHCSA